jgi:hypothetical protein
MAMDETDRERRFERRGGRRLVAGGIIATIVGAVLGWIAGALIFTPWGVGDWAMTLAGAILIGGFGFVIGGMSSLEPVDPGAEPYSPDGSDANTPDGQAWTSPERDERSA